MENKYIVETERRDRRIVAAIYCWKDGTEVEVRECIQNKYRILPICLHICCIVHRTVFQQKRQCLCTINTVAGSRPS
jgi:hypothetical protein